MSTPQPARAARSSRYSFPVGADTPKFDPFPDLDLDAGMDEPHTPDPDYRTPEVLINPAPHKNEEGQITSVEMLPPHVVQGEWDQTVRRVKEVAEVMDYSVHTSGLHYMRLVLKRTKDLNIEGIERILFQNLLLVPKERVMRTGSVEFFGDWLWRWRKATDYKVEKDGRMSSLAPDVPRDRWLYRFNVVEVE